MSITGKRFATTVCVLLGFGVSQAFAQGGLTKPKQGQGGSVVKGSAGTGGSQGEKGLEHCDAPMGAMAVVEPQNEVLAALGRYHLSSPVSLIRLMIQQSNCFIVVERGVGMQNMMQERQLSEAGEARSGSNMGKGQMVAADFILTPNVVFSENNAGGVGGGIASGLFGHKVGAVAGGLKFKEAQTSMLVADSRSGVQWRRLRAARRRPTSASAPACSAASAARLAAATATPTKARSSPRRCSTTTTTS
jgi:hypothetical protein